MVYGFNVGCPANIKRLAARDGVPVKTYRIIYELLDDARAEMEALLPKEVMETDAGEMVIRGVFRTERTEVIAGGEMLSGRALPGMLARVVRGKQFLGEVEVVSLQREKLEAKELVEGEVGGVALKTAKKLQLEVGDRLKFFTREVKERSL